MKILNVAPEPFFEPRGTPASVLHRLRALLELGHGVHVVTYPFGDDPEVPGLVLHRTARPVGVRSVAIGPSVSKVALDVPLFIKAYRLARSGGFDLLQTHEEAAYAGGWIARAAGLPHLYDMHSSLPQQLRNFDRYDRRPVVAAFERLERWTLARSDGVIAICPALRDHVRGLGYRGPLAMIENTLDFEPPDLAPHDVAALRRRLGITDEQVVVYTGSLEVYQGLDLLIRAAPEVARRRSSVRFVIVGGTRGQIRDLRRRAAARDVGARFTFVPAVPPADVFLYHRLATALVTCRTRGTNTPLKIYQYLRAGRPIVATDIHSHTQVLDRTTAQLVDPDPGAVADGIVRVLTDAGRARGLARNAERLADERYGKAVYMRRLRAILRATVAQHGRRTATATPARPPDADDADRPADHDDAARARASTRRRQ